MAGSPIKGMAAPNSSFLRVVLRFISTGLTACVIVSCTPDAGLLHFIKPPFRRRGFLIAAFFLLLYHKFAFLQRYGLKNTAIMTRFLQTLKDIDSINAEDPHLEVFDEQTYPNELL